MFGSHAFGVICILGWGDEISLVPKVVGKHLIGLVAPHHKPFIQHSKIPLGMLNPIIAKDVQLDLL
jgi:hypothetical protein